MADTPDRSVLQQVREGQNYMGLTPYGEDDLLHVRIVIADRGNPERVLQALYPLSQRITELSDEVQAAFTRYRELSFLRQSLKFSFQHIRSGVGCYFFSATLVGPGDRPGGCHQCHCRG